MKHFRKLFLLCGGVIASFIVRAQDSLITAPDTIDVIVYSGKFAEHSARVAQTIRVIRDRATLNFQPNTADVLVNNGGVFVQKSQQGGGSPVIRGFEASRIVLMVDGVRMNNAIYRAGHLQNIITVDNSILNRIEVIYGPASTLYGSDALGGVVNLFTKDPAVTAPRPFTGNAMARYSTATEESKLHLDFNIAGKKWASLTSLSYADFGDVKQGKRRRAAYPTFGLKPFIVTRSGNLDVVTSNPDPHKQTPAGYQQWDLLQKISFHPKQNTRHMLNLQYSGSSDVPRYDRLTDVSGGNPVFAEWYYGPQVRALAAYSLDMDGLHGFFREVKLNANFQHIEESRIDRRFGNNNRNYNWETVQVAGLNLDAKRYSGKHEFHLGAESYTNFVHSTAIRRNIVTGAESKLQTRYSDGPTHMTSNAVYAQHTFKFNDHWTLNDGLRLNHVGLSATFVDTSILHLPFTKASQQHLALTGNLGVVYAGPSKFRLAVLVSSGFRAPNVDDLTKVFDTRPGEVIVPNPDLKPEYTYNAELTVGRQGKKLSLGTSLFYTMFRNVLVVDRTRFNGSDSMVYQGVNSAVLSMQNKARAFIYGISANASVSIFDHTSLEGVITYTYGRYRHQGIEVPLDHISPLFGRIALKHNRQAWQAEVYGLFNGWKRIADYSPSGEDNQRYATPEGMPSWFTLNIRTMVGLGGRIQLQLALENILDLNYRYFGSGISAPGRNMSLSLRTSF